MSRKNTNILCAEIIYSNILKFIKFIAILSLTKEYLAPQHEALSEVELVRRNLKSTRFRL